MKDRLRVCIVAGLVVGFSLLNYLTNYDSRYLHIFYRGLLFLPVMLAGFWLGLRGALITSLSICALYIPYAMRTWQAFSTIDFDRIIDIALYNLVALVMGILSDRQKVYQRVAQEAENLAAAGKSLSAVAHDMKTPLIAIGGFSQLVKKYIHEDHPHRDKLDIIIEETRRLENMVKDMLDFSRPLELNRSVDCLDTVIRECLEVVAVEAQNKKVTITHTSAQGLSAVAIDRMRIKQVVINLVVNAIHASPEGQNVIVSYYQTKGRSIIDVTDRGCGIPHDQRNEIFMPFFSTKKDGTGLGLPIASKIIKAHQGQIQVLDNPEGGTIFRVILPRNSDQGAHR